MEVFLFCSYDLYMNDFTKSLQLRECCNSYRTPTAHLNVGFSGSFSIVLL